ncbi:hypothetical protein J132_07484, partial [Termitomyces sp. J132]
ISDSLYDDTSAYYGTVDQQGRLTLHLHMLLWLCGSLSPDEARHKIMDPESDFQRALVEYLESTFTGDFITGTMDQVTDAKARSFMTKMVNVLSAKSEMGSSMISMYLLGNPDHYTDHTFMNVHWPSFVCEAKHAWTDNSTSEWKNLYGPDKINIIKKRGHVVGLSPVFDYIYRGPELQDMSLYEWMARCKRVKLSKRSNKGLSNKDEDELNPLPHASSTIIQFTDQHPLFDTHGPMLPHYDKGDKEEYSLTTLTLFKPWKSRLDLKDTDESWSTAFATYKFNEKQQTLMKNMNIEYKCMNAHDDFYAQLKSGGVLLPGNHKLAVDLNDIQQTDEMENVEEGFAEDYAHNVDKYAINTIGTFHFALETNQKLTDFFREDSVTNKNEEKDKRPLSVECCLPNDQKINISRTQVKVLINYAITNYASQGKTRQFNPIDLFKCQTHQACYTALSQSTTASGMLIVRGSDRSVIQGKASGALHQEFRDLEILDKTTCLRYIGKLPVSLHDAPRRSDLIVSFCKCKNDTYHCPNIHPTF